MFVYISLLFLVGLIACRYYKKMMNSKFGDPKLSQSKKKAIFITGCDTGFGYSLILHNLENHDPKHNLILIAGCYYPNESLEGSFKFNIISTLT